MTFKKAIAETPDINDAWCPGLRALNNRDKEHIDPEDTKRLTGSVALDSKLRRKYPNDERWDYGIGHRPTNLTKETVYWVEIHPASNGEVKVVLAKLQWLQEWLRKNAPHLYAMRKAYVWISSGKTSFTLSSPQQKQFALLGLEHKGRRLKIPNEPAA